MSENEVYEANAGRPFWRNRLIQVVLVLFVLGVVAIVVGVIVYFSYRSSRDKPLAVDVYPGATLVNQEVIYDGYDHQQYLVADAVEPIEKFYDDQDGMTCQRQYQHVQETVGQSPVLDGYLYTSCIVDRSGLGMTQYTKVVIQPRYDEAGSATGDVIVDVQRHWGQ